MPVRTCYNLYLFNAVKGGHIECVQQCLRGADLNREMYENENLVTHPVYSAIAEGNIEVAKLMMEHTDFGSLEKHNPTFQDEQDNLPYIALGALNTMSKCP